jgi:hypothetical protein
LRQRARPNTWHGLIRALTETSLLGGPELRNPAGWHSHRSDPPVEIASSTRAVTQKLPLSGAGRRAGLTRMEDALRCNLSGKIMFDAVVAADG